MLIRKGGELYGFNYHPITCAQFSPEGDRHFLYKILEENDDTAIIEYAISPELNWLVFSRYRTIKRNDNWLLDGILCYPDMDFNMNSTSDNDIFRK